MRYASTTLRKHPGIAPAAIARIGSYIPARRASRLDPTMALRHE